MWDVNCANLSLYRDFLSYLTIWLINLTSKISETDYKHFELFEIDTKKKKTIYKSAFSYKSSGISGNQNTYLSVIKVQNLD